MLEYLAADELNRVRGGGLINANRLALGVKTIYVVVNHSLYTSNSSEPGRLRLLRNGVLQVRPVHHSIVLTLTDGSERCLAHLVNNQPLPFKLWRRRLFISCFKVVDQVEQAFAYGQGVIVRRGRVVSYYDRNSELRLSERVLNIAYDPTVGFAALTECGRLRLSTSLTTSPTYYPLY